MGKKLLHMALAVIAAVLPTIPSMAQIPEGYYNFHSKARRERS